MRDEIPIQKSKVFRVKTNFDKGIAFENQCKNEGTNINAKLNQLIENSLLGQKKYFHAGVSRFEYDRTTDRFRWAVYLDSGEKKEVISNLSSSFLGNIFNESEKALLERSDWIHQKKQNSVDIPGELIGGEE